MLQIKEMNLRYGERKIISNFSCEIDDKDKIFISGDSGSGKSSWMKALLFLRQFEGEIFCDGQRVLKDNIKDYRLNFAYISQSPPLFDASVKDFLQEVFSFSSNSKLSYDPQQNLQLLESLRLKENILQSSFNDLSGGEKQKLSLIRALQLKRRFYLFDEIDKGLDENSREKVLSVIRDYCPGFLFISHHNDSQKICSHEIHFDAAHLEKKELQK